jgi:hypothetical protein
MAERLVDYDHIMNIAENMEKEGKGLREFILTIRFVFEPKERR